MLKQILNYNAKYRISKKEVRSLSHFTSHLHLFYRKTDIKR